MVSLHRLPFAILLGVSLIASPAAADTGEDEANGHHRTERAPFPWPGEQFFYSLRVNGAEAMRATIKAGAMRKNGDKVYVPLGFNVRSLGFFDNVYPVNDRGDTYLNPSTMRPYRSEKLFREAGKRRTYEVDYVHSLYSAQVEKSKPNRTQKFKRAIPGTTHDMMTWLYDLRSRDYEIGDKFRFYIYDGWKLSHVYMKVIGKEDLYTPAGWFKAWKFKFVRKVLHSKHNRRGGKPIAPILKVKSHREHHGYFWLSRDENHLPLRVTIPTSFGFGEAVLLKYNRHSN